MAITFIKARNARVDHVITYIRNPEKTTEGSAQQMADLHSIEELVTYAANDFKTEERKFVSVLNCLSESTATDEFLKTKRYWETVSQRSKTSGRLCYHAIQSFKPGETDPETAHKIGVELARELWGDRFQVVIATHLNTNHLHNHFVINSVSYLDGKKFHSGSEDLARLRDVSDRLCAEHKLSVIKNPEGRKKSYTEHQAEKQGKPTIRSTIRADIDRAIEASITENEFYQVMAEMGYKFHIYTETGSYLKYPTIQPPGSKGRFRLHKLGEAYTFDGIAQRIYDNYSRRLPFPEERRRNLGSYRYRGSFRKRPKATGLRALYLYYCYLLKIIVKRPASIKRVPVSLREDIIKLDRYIAETRFLGAYKIDTVSQLASVKLEAEAKLESLYDLRREIRNAQKRAIRTGNPDEIADVKVQLDSVASEIRKYRKEVKLCDSIADRSDQVQLNMAEINRQRITQRKENERYEPSWRRSGTDREDVSQWR